jgi:hypothetical protein
MAEDHFEEMSAEGEIEEVFALAKRGQVLVLKQGFRGTIHRNGTVKGDKGTATYAGPEYLDSVGQGKSSVGVIVDPSVKELFTPGQRVTFYRKALTP